MKKEAAGINDLFPGTKVIIMGRMALYL